MENPEEVLQSLDEFVKLKPKDIPKELEDYLSYVAKTGDPVYQWSLVKCLFREKLVNVITEFYEGCPTIELPSCPNVDSFNYEIMKNSLLERLESFVSAPFTVQRLCELLTSPKKQYSRADKFMRAVEKNILVVSTREPGVVRRIDANQTELLNGISEGPTVELVETISTECMNLVHSSVRLAMETAAVASTTKMLGAEAKCSHSVDPGTKIVPEWMNDPNLTNASRPSVSERVAMIEKADAGSSADIVAVNKLTSEFHAQVSQPIPDASLLEEEEDDEDLIPSSQEDSQYILKEKLKPASASNVSLPDIADLPSPDSSETTAAVATISDESSNPLVESSSLDIATTPPSMSCQDSSASIEPTSSEKIAEVPTTALIVDTSSDDADSSVESSSLSTEPVLPEVVNTVTASEVCKPSTDIETPSLPNASEVSTSSLEETPEASVETPQVVDNMLSAEEPIESLTSKQNALPVTEAEQSIPAAIVLDAELIAEPPLAEVEARHSEQDLDVKITVPDAVAEPETAKPTSAEERDREMMVQNERIESVIQETADQDVEQTFFREAPMESIPLETVPLNSIPVMNIPLEEQLPLEVPMEDKPQDAEPEAMEVDETSQSDEPMDQEDMSPKQSSL